MKFKQITIIGLGLIGGSFALSLRKAGFSGRIIGTGRNKENLAKAKESAIIDEYSTVPSEAVKDADLILLATPVGQFQSIVEGIKRHIKKGTIVTDVGSVKAEIVEKLEPLMPEGVSFVAGHPIAGKECSGIDSASSDLFDNARFIATPVPNTDSSALEKILDLWKSFGSQVILMTPDEHDAIFAHVSHLPHIVAYVLINTILDLSENGLPHGGRGLRDMTRIALSPPELWRDICAYNRENIIKSLEHFLSSVSHIKMLVEKSEWESLNKEFQKAKTGRQTIE